MVYNNTVNNLVVHHLEIRSSFQRVILYQLHSPLNSVLKLTHRYEAKRSQPLSQGPYPLPRVCNDVVLDMIMMVLCTAANIHTTILCSGRKQRIGVSFISPVIFTPTGSTYPESFHLYCLSVPPHLNRMN